MATDVTRPSGPRRWPGNVAGRGLPPAGLLGRPARRAGDDADDGVRAAYLDAFRTIVAVALTGRAIAVLAPVCALLRGYPPGWPDAVLFTVAVACPAALAGAWRRAGEGTPLLLVDLAALSGVTVLVAALPGPAAGAYRHMLLPMVAGVVLVWAAAWGAAVGVCVVAAALPFQVLAAQLESARDGGSVLTLVLVRMVWLAVTLLVALAVLALLVRQTRAAASHAAQMEHNRMLRLMHDTALQCLEVLSLRSTSDDADPVATVAEMRATARAEVTRLRAALRGAAADPGGLAAGLGEVAAEAVTRGLRVDLVTADLDGVGVTRARHDALCGATSAALSNVRRHSGVARVTVRLDRVDTGVQIVVRDHGQGFPADGSRFGFGIRESILARLREVGGRAGVEAAPGRGTRITLWVPEGAR
ncbi:MAG: hypothetical protein V7603_2220 [Micromonosporaceae bacterium]